MIKDAAALFAAKGEEARDIVENLKNEARDALDLALSEAPSSRRERYRYATKRIFPLLLRIEDEGERGAALDDVANELKLGKRDLRKAFARFEERVRQDQGEVEHDEEEAGAQLVPEPGSERYERAMQLLKSPHFFGLFVRYTGMFGHVGDYVAKLLALLCALSVLMGRPIQPSTHAQSSAGKNALWDAVLSFLPPEMVVRRTGLSAKALFRTVVDLSHKVLYIQEIVGSEEADYTIRTLQSDGRLVYEATEKAPDGAMRNVVHEVEGPTVVVQTTTRNHLHPENETRVFSIFVDESSRQTRRIIESYLREAEGRGADSRERERILEAFRDAFRLLEPGEVVIPYARRIRIPDSPVRVRRDARRLLDLVRVVAWAHQHQRDRDEWGRIVATEDDFRKALGLAAKSLSSAWKSLAPVEEDVLKAIEKLPQSKKRNGFGRADLEVAGRDDRRVQDALKSLNSTGYLDCDGRRGPQGYRYTLVRESGERTLGISLRQADDSDEDVHENPGQGPETDEEEDEGERGSRGIARIGERAIEAPLSPGKDAIARSRGVDDEGYFEDGEPEEGEEVDCLAELTERGWYRAQSVFVAEDDSVEGDPLGEDQVADALRRRIPIFHGGQEKLRWYGGDDTPLVLSAEEALELGAEDPSSGSWPTTPEEMSTRLRRAVHLLQRDAQEFYDPSFDEWCFEARVYASADSPKRYKAAYLHAECWRTEHSGEELWVFVALREGWRVPYREIEEAVWSSTTTGGTTDEIDPEASNHPFEF